MIACGTDHIHARQDSLVGSIGVIANMNKFSGLADKLGIQYERFVGGEHKDTHRPLKELDEEERGYWQTVIDNSYDNFVNLVAESRNLTPDHVRDTEAEIFDGVAALEEGLVDKVGSRESFLHYVADDLGRDRGDLKIRRYDGSKKVWGNVENTVASMAYAFGHGLGTALNGGSSPRLEYRV